MKKLTLCLAAVLGAMFTLSAAELNVNGAFDKINPKTKLPTGWFFNAWPGFKPQPAFKLVKDGKVNALEFTKPNQKSGFGFNYGPTFNAKKGQTITVTARVKGSGKMFLALQGFANNAWTGIMPYKYVDLTPAWKEIKVELPVVDIKGKAATTRVMLTFGVGGKSQGMSISTLKADLK